MATTRTDTRPLPHRSHDHSVYPLTTLLLLWLLLLINLATTATAETLSFISPNAENLPNGTGPAYTIGETIDVSWTTPFNLTTLEIWQGPVSEGRFLHEVLACELLLCFAPSLPSLSFLNCQKKLIRVFSHSLSHAYGHDVRMDGEHVGKCFVGG